MSETLLQDRAEGLPPRLICVIGMHRSGTSCLTGSLQAAGLALGKCHTENPYNRKGNRENQAFVNLNDAVLKHNQGSWDSPPEAASWPTALREQARQLLAEHAGDEVFGFKDPRTLLVLQGWKNIYPAMEFAGTFRNPNAVARSLNQRSGMPREQGLALWWTYNRLLWEQHRKHAFPLLCFDEEDDLLRSAIGRIAAQLGLDPERARDFFEPTLRNVDSESSGASLEHVPWRLRRLYKKLRRHSV